MKDKGESRECVRQYVFPLSLTVTIQHINKPSATLDIEIYYAKYRWAECQPTVFPQQLSTLIGSVSKSEFTVCQY